MADKNTLQQIKLQQIGTINIDDVIQNHNTLLNCGDDVSFETDECHELITILGGMNNILTFILTKQNPYNLNQSQLKQMNDIFSAKNKNNDKKVVVYSNQLTSFEEVDRLNTNISDVSLESPSTSTEQYETIYFKKSDTLLHDLFGKEKGEYIINNILFNKWMIILFMSIIFITIIVSIVSRFTPTYKIEWNVWFYPAEIFIILYSLILLISVRSEEH
eukprot:362902_1